MAEVQTVNGRKRPHPQDGPSQDDHKRVRSGTNSPAPATNGASKVNPDIAKAIAEAKARAAALASSRSQAGGGIASQPALQAPSDRPMTKLEEMRARVAALTGKNAAAAAAPPPPPPSTAIPPPPFPDDAYSRARGGLSAALHPALLETGKDSSAKTSLQSRLSSSSKGKPTSNNKSHLKGKKQLDLSGPNLDEFTNQNPYFDASMGTITATMKSRAPKPLKFNEKGKYIAQAASMRRLEALEAMRKRIAAASKKALIEDDLAEKKFLVPAPPEIEWWDEGLVSVPSTGYANINYPSGLKVSTPDSLITRLIQHPALIQPPGDRLIPAPKPMYLTKTEQKKIRRQRRMADLKETQAKIRLGLIEPPPDKVKLGNLMRVLGEEAVKDPTAVEARVTRQIAERKAKHLQTNEDRKLTPQERHSKLEQQKAADLAKGVHLSVYRVDSLANGRHRFKVSKNVEQLGGTGLLIFHPKFCLLLTEFGEHGMRAYKKLMLNRIDWTENSPSQVREGNKNAVAAFLAAEDEHGVLRDLATNRCQLVFEGMEKDRVFRGWKTRTCETDKEAMEALGRTKMENFWTLARGMGS